MTQDEIIRMAEEAGLAFGSDEYPDIWQTYMNVGREEIERFAALVAAHERKLVMDLLHGAEQAAVLAEREACAKVCDDRIRAMSQTGGIAYAKDCAAAIRARGETK